MKSSIFQDVLKIPTCGSDCESFTSLVNKFKIYFNKLKKQPIETDQLRLSISIFSLLKLPDLDCFGFKTIVVNCGILSVSIIFLRSFKPESGLEDGIRWAKPVFGAFYE